MLAPEIEIKSASFPADGKTVRELFREYADSLGIDLAFQDFEQELATLPGKYAAPSGCILIAWQDDQPIGCVALRPIDDRDCEMKRLYLRPSARGIKLGRQLAERICTEARSAGYQRILLDTLAHMAAARALYSSLGFQPIEPYIYNPIPCAIFMARDL
ncbi:GNAT family N-acetyltransferase [Haloferula sp. BvORR071]|uniref:GNAT family N-acetyltransferase n=1 Tax=Haloferula sp. BvORR071 TaxID=1396141 RepID=UPI000550FAE8|nr:GNAT family N-acetyltransferase [Haloferula sp. BvORR071]